MQRNKLTENRLADKDEDYLKTKQEVGIANHGKKEKNIDIRKKREKIRF